MKGKTLALVLGGIALLLVITGVLVYRSVFSGSPVTDSQGQEQVLPTDLPEADASITVDITKSKVKANTLVLSVAGLGSNYKTLEYEITYESQSVVQGLTSQPLDLSGKDTFTRDDIYLGTCSGSVCRPHLGVEKVSVALVFTDTQGKQTQFSKDYTL